MLRKIHAAQEIPKIYGKMQYKEISISRIGHIYKTEGNIIAYYHFLVIVTKI